jgi:hypothetical protein
MHARIRSATNPFSFGTLATDEAFADREDEVRQLVGDAMNGQDVVVFAPRRIGKSSLVAAVMRELVGQGVLVADIDLWKVPNKEKLAEALAAAIYSDIARLRDRAVEKALAPFRGLRITPTMTIDPDSGRISFKFAAGAEPQDIDATIERLLELPAELAADQGKIAVLVLDEFQEVKGIGNDLTRLMRSVFQLQPNVAHIYLGSKRHLMEEIFNNEDEPFWKSAKQVQLGPIPAGPFSDFIRSRFSESGKGIERGVVQKVVETTGGHPYATQRLCYEIWQRTSPRASAGEDEYGLAFQSVLNAEDSHFGLVWEDSSKAQQLLLLALATAPGRPFTQSYRTTHSLPAASSVQRAIEGLTNRELIQRDRDGVYRIMEPFLAEWLRQNVVDRF